MYGFEARYLSWLMSLVKSKKYSEHDILLESLWRQEFYSAFPNDDNREDDGRRLREMWADEVGENLGDTAEFGPCRALEMMIAISNRMEFELDGSRYNKSAADLFWELVKNLGLGQYDNYTMINANGWDHIHENLQIWLDRDYGKDGVGSLFPLKNWRQNSPKGQNRVEIWYQMCSYLLENYPI